MASTSTGYNKWGIWKEQFSTAGQVMRWSSGSKAYFSNDAEIEMESGSTMNVESGAAVRINNGAYFVNENVLTITASGVYGTTVAPKGIIWLNPTSSGNVTVHFSTPKYIGQEVTWMIGNSTKKKARIISGSTKSSIHLTTARQIAFSTKSQYTPAAGKKARVVVTMKAISTTGAWVVTNLTTAATYTFSTAQSS